MYNAAEEARRAIPKLQQLPETCALFERVRFTEDCRKEVDRRLAAEALCARLRVFALREKLEDPAIERAKTAMAADDPHGTIYVSSLYDELLYDTQLDLRKQEFGSRWDLGDPPGPYHNMLWERRRARFASGWTDANPNARYFDRHVGLRLADALDLAEPHDVANRPYCYCKPWLYGADAIRRDEFKDRKHCLAWWEGLLPIGVYYGGRVKRKGPKALELDPMQEQKVAELIKRFA